MISFKKEEIFIVTGASSGIGKSISLLLNELGGTVVGIGRNEERLLELKDKSKYPENMFIERKELTEDIDGLPNYMKLLKEKYGKFQGLVCSAGITSIEPLQILDYSRMKYMFDINYFAPVFMAKGFADKRINNGKGSSIVFISSIATTIYDRGMISYTSTKSALQSSSKIISKELNSLYIRVNSISPTYVLETGIADNDLVKEIINTSAKNKPLPKSYDVANLVAFLLSDKSYYINGQNYILDSGFMIEL